MVNGIVLQLLFVLFATKYGLSHQNNTIKQLVYNGEELNPEINKHLIQLEIGGVSYSNFGPESKKISCSGSIISDQWILTSAHCFLPSFIIFDTIIKRKGRDEFHQIAEGIEVFLKDSSYVLGDYSAENIEKDLALVYTGEWIKFNDHVQPIPLATRSIPVGRSAIVSGFGEVAPGISGARQGVVQMSTCPERGTSLLCSYSEVKAAAGDSGGSLVYKGKLAGVTSTGCRDVHYFKRCVTYYVNVAANLDWISDTIAQK